VSVKPVAIQIFIGEVVDSLHTEGEPLIFFNGRYATTAGLSIPA